MVVIQRDVLMSAIISPIRFSRTSPLKPTRWQVTGHLGCNRLGIQCGMCMMRTLLQGVKNDPVWFLNTHVFESLVHVPNKMFGLSGCASRYATKYLSVISFHCDFKVLICLWGNFPFLEVFLCPNYPSAICHIQTLSTIQYILMIKIPSLVICEQYFMLTLKLMFC